jgi:hypothetical protein
MSADVEPEAITEGAYRVQAGLTEQDRLSRDLQISLRRGTNKQAKRRRARAQARAERLGDPERRRIRESLRQLGSVGEPTRAQRRWAGLR